MPLVLHPDKASGLLAGTDYDGGAREWPDRTALDEAYAALDSYGILLSWWLCTRLRIHHACPGYGSLWILGRQVCLVNPIASSPHPHAAYSYFSGAEAPPVAYPEGFQGNEIPLDGELVAKLVHRRLSLAEEADD